MPKAKRTRVLIDTFHLYNALTGVRTYTTQLCQGVESCKGELGAEYVIFPDWRKANQSSFLRGKLSIPKKILNHLSTIVWKQLVLPFVILFKRIDVVYAPDFVVPAIRFGSLGMPVIHDTFFWDFKENYPLLWRWYYKPMIWMGLTKKTVIIATSHYTKKNIQRAVADKRPVEVVYQSPKLLEVPESGKNQVLDKYAIDKPYYLHVGVFDKRKNIKLLVKAFATAKAQSNQPLQLVLVGEEGLGKNLNDFEKVKGLIAELKLEKHVVITGFVSNEELAVLYQNALAYVFPSLDEGFGIPVLEAMHFGVPVIISDRGSLSEIAGNAALVFEATDEKDLSERMSDALDSDLRNTLIEKGKLRAAEFSERNFAKQLDEIVLQYAK